MKFNPLSWNLHWQISFSIILVILVNYILIPILNENILALLLETSKFTGNLFIKTLKMMVIPLVITSMISGVLQIESNDRIGLIGIRTLTYYISSGFLAVIIALLLVNIFQPGNVEKEIAYALIGQSPSSINEIDSFEKLDSQENKNIFNLFLRMFPENIIQASSNNGQLLGVIVFSILFGVFANNLPKKYKTLQKDFWESIQQTILNMTTWFIKFSPIGIFGLLLPVLYKSPLSEIFGPLIYFSLIVLLGLIIHAFITLSILLKIFTKVNPLKHIKSMTPVLLTAFSTASSSATLPLTMDTMSRKANVSKKTCAFTLPLGATINMDGTALYECIVVIFISQIYASITGIDFTIYNQVLVMFLALTTSIGVAGIPAASMVAISIILPAVGLPIEAIGIIWITDRILDMFRTSINVYSDTVAAIIVSQSQGEKPYN